MVIYDPYRDQVVVNDAEVNGWFESSPFREGLREATRGHEGHHRNEYNSNKAGDNCLHYDSDADTVRADANEEMEGHQISQDRLYQLAEEFNCFGRLIFRFDGSIRERLTSGWSPTGIRPRDQVAWTVFGRASDDPVEGTDWGIQNGFYLLTTFELPHSRANYGPHDTFISFNGHRVGELTDTIPEGRYAFPLAPEYLNPNGADRITVSTSGVNTAHYVVVTNFQLTMPVLENDRFVVATSQDEANHLYAASTDINHNQSDIVVFADPTVKVPERPVNGERISLSVNVINLGEQRSNDGQLRVFNYDPLPSDESSSLDLVSSLEAALVDYVSDKAKLNDVAGTVSIPPLEPMSQATLPVEITFRTGETTRLYFVAETAENDFNPSNNVMELTFVAPEEKSPLMGVDDPDLSSVPVLNSMVELPALPEVETFTSLDLERFINQLPYLEELRKLESAGRDLLNRLLRP